MIDRVQERRRCIADMQIVALEVRLEQDDPCGLGT
jgi:hypothetical protein